MTDQHLKHKQMIHTLWGNLNTADLAQSTGLWQADLAPGMSAHLSHPINDLNGTEAFLESFWKPLKRAMPNLRRQHYILMADTKDGGDWVTSTGYYRGSFMTDWLGFPLAGKPVSLRFGEFVRMENNQVQEIYMLLDLIDLLRQAGHEVLPRETGETGFVPGPIMQDGVRLGPKDPAVTEASRNLVHTMIYDGLLQYDQQSLESMNMRAYWHPDMLWYGPAGIGITRGVDGFEDHHQRPFLHAFPDRRGGNHIAFLADGPYVASSGWPSIHATHAGDYLGLPATNQPITMRVMDWWRADGDLLAENWVMLDLPHTFLQLGRDLFAQFNGVRV